MDTEHQAVMAANWPLTALAAQSEPSPQWAAGAGKQAQHGEAGRRCDMTRGAGGSHGVMHDGPAQWKVEIEETQSLRCERAHGSVSEKGGEGCAIRCDGWQDKVFKCHEIQPEQGTRKGRFARSLLATLS